MIPYNLLLKPPLGTPLNRGHKLAKGLVYYPLMNEKVSTTILDSSGNRNTGTFGAGAFSPSWVAGKFGSTLDFDGGDYVIVANSPVFNINTAFTISIWVKWRDSIASGTILLKGHDVGALRNYQFWNSGDDLYFSIGNGSVFVSANKANVLSADTWHFLTGVYNGTNLMLLYLDGVLLDTSSFTGSPNLNANDLIIGAQKATGGYTDGLIDLPMIHNRGLSAGEIALLHQEPFCMFKDPAEIALLGGYVEVGEWFGVSSTHIDSFCGEEVGRTLAEALDGTDYWEHLVNHVHSFVIDLGQSYNVQKVKGRSNRGWDPTDVNIYVSDDTGDWGAAVATGISTWQGTNDFIEIDVTDKNGRYVKVEIVNTESVSDYIQFGHADGMTIFDVYVEEAIPEGNAGIMTTNTGFWGPTF